MTKTPQIEAIPGMTPMGFSTKFKVGDRVVLSGNFLRDTGIFTGDIPNMVGTVTKVKTLAGFGTAKFVELIWDGNRLPSTVNMANLALVGSPDVGAR